MLTLIVILFFVDFFILTLAVFLPERKRHAKKRENPRVSGYTRTPWAWR